MNRMPLKDIIYKPISGEWGTDYNGDNGVKVLRTTNFTNEGKLDFEKEIAIRNIDLDKVKRKKLIHGDIIIEKSGGSPTQPVGRVVYFDKSDGDTYLFNNFTSVLRVNEKVYSKFLFYYLFYLHNQGQTLKYQNKTTGIINFKLNRFIDEVKIPIPSLEKQKKIVATLDEAYKLIENRKKTIQQMDCLVQSLFYDIFGDLNLNSKKWNKKKIGELVDPIETWKKSEEMNKEISYVDIASISNIEKCITKQKKVLKEKAPSRAKYKLKEKDIVISTVRPNLNAVAIVESENNGSVGTSGFCVLRPNLEFTNTEYLFEICKSEFFINRLMMMVKGANYPSISNKDILNLEIPCPPKVKQDKFKMIFTETKKQKNIMKKELAESEKIFKSILQKSFKSEIK